MRLVVGALILAGVIGCARDNREELIRKVLSADPGFSEVLARYQQIRNLEATYEQELELKRLIVDRQIEQLRQGVAATAEEVERKKRGLYGRLDPEREAWQEALGRAEDGLRELQTQRASLGRAIVKLRKVVRLAEEAWTDEERARQQEQLQDMVRDGDRLDREIALFKEHMQLLQTKLRLVSF
ncbi:MAG TPA: hypothetical protein VGB20_07140 [bacterium]